MNEITFTAKDLSYLEDIYNWNSNTEKLITNIASNINNEEVKNYLDKICKEHSNICTNIKNILGGI